MTVTPSWSEAQSTEKDFWDGMAQNAHAILQVLESNSAKAEVVKKYIPATAKSCLEVGVGPFGVGIVGFLCEIPSRIVLDPLPPVSMDGPVDDPSEAFGQIKILIRNVRKPLRYLVGSGADIPMGSESVDVAICCNVIDHAADPEAILRDICRVLKPGGVFFLDVDSFSILGLVKWHTWTKHVHKDEILVKAHPHRMYESDIPQKLQRSGFAVQKISGHTFTSNLIGHARVSTFLGKKPAR